MNSALIRRVRSVTGGLALGGAVALGTSGCGGAGGAGSGDTLVGVVLVNFVQSGEDNLPLNRVLEFNFSSAIDPNSIDFSAIQLREGPAFGLSVPGSYIVLGSQVLFQPRLPGLCDLTDGGFKPNTDYRVTLLGSPEEFAIRNLAQAPLIATVSATFHTRIETDPELFEDAVPGVAPTVVQTSPVDAAYPNGPTVVFPVVANPADSSYPEVYIGGGNRVVIDFSENLYPCSVNENTVRFYQYAVGNQPTMPNGFLGSDITPGDPFTWGSGTATSPARRVRSNYVLTQTLVSTRLVITPQFTDAFGNPEFPDNALLVVEVTNSVRDFGQTPLFPKSFAFVTQNRPAVNSQRVIEFAGETAIDLNQTTADVNTSRSISKAQGWVLFAGDGDNGLVLTRASNPDNANGPPGCTTPAGIPQANDGFLDDFDPLSDANLDTGSTRNTCKNSTDGTTATVFEFRSFHIRNNVTVRIIGRNPAIILVQGDVLIDSGGALLARGDGLGGAPQSRGTNGAMAGTGGPNPSAAPGGTGVAGGGNGGESPTTPQNGLSQHGTTGYFNLPPGTVPPDVGTVGGIGAGHGNISTNWPGPQTPGNRNGNGGGGGGHATAGVLGQCLGTGTTPQILDGAPDGASGGTYGDVTSKMIAPEAGSGGGGAGTIRGTLTTYCSGTGGGGGAGGGFVDLTAKGDIFVSGRIDAAGSSGGGGANTAGSWYSYQPVTGGGGGGSGGGIRLLTPQSINLGPNASITVVGGVGGIGQAQAQNPGAPANNGGAGGIGRLSLEDGDSVITGYIAGSTIPAEGAQGFYRGQFDSTRFQGGGLTPQAVTQLIDMGPTNPSYDPPVQNYGTQEDFIAGVPLVSTRGFNAPSIFFEAQGFPANPDGTANLLAGTGWKSVGYFKDSSSAAFPTWVLGTPAIGNTPGALPDGQVPSLPQGNTGGSIANLNGMQFIKLRITFYLKSGIQTTDEGPFVDRWTIHFSYDQ